MCKVLASVISITDVKNQAKTANHERTLIYAEFQGRESIFFSNAPDKLEKVVLVKKVKWEEEGPREDKLGY